MATTTSRMTSAGLTSSHPIEQFARRHHRRLERHLRKSFRHHKLSDEDIGDALAETYKAALETPATADFHAERLSAWAYQVAHFRAVAIIRKRDGRTPSGGDAVTSARQPLSLDALWELGGEVVADDRLRDDELAARLDDEALVHSTREIGKALEKLPRDQRQVIERIVVEGCTTRQAAELLGISRSEVSRRYQRALERLAALCSAQTSDQCAKARGLLHADEPLSADLIGWRDAHLAGCFACQIVAGRRIQVLVPLLPVLGPGRLARFAHRIGGLAASHGTRLPSEAVRAGVGSAAAPGGAGGLSVVGAGAMTKVGACVAALVACAGGAAVIARPAQSDARPPAPASTRAAVISRARPTPASTPTPAVTISAATNVPRHGSPPPSPGRSARRGRRDTASLPTATATPTASPRTAATVTPTMPASHVTAPEVPSTSGAAPGGFDGEFSP